MPILSYDDFRAQFATLCARYSPDLSESYDHARSAIHHRERDTAITPAELDALLRYCETAYFGEQEDVPPTTTIEERINQLALPDRSYLMDYKWCATCNKMMGIANHTHCASCNSAMTGGTNNPCGKCRNCCRCVKCGACGHHYATQEEYNGCRSCSTCRNCCRCIPCRYESCKTKKKINCQNCGGCGDCCQCKGAAYGKPWRASRPNKRTQFECSRLSGAEWEYNRVTNREPLQAWVRKWRGRIHHDGSCGEEVVTPPMAGDFMVACISSLGEAFKTSGGTADTRCSIHVHIDSRDVHWNDLKRLVTVYSKHEAFLYMLAGEHRSGNRYCKPCGKEYGETLTHVDWKERLIKVALADNDGRHHLRTGGVTKKANGRYRGLNLCPWLVGRATKQPDTTIEFRLHENTLDPTEVVSWIQLVTKLVDWSTTATDADMEKLPTDPVELFGKIIAPETGQWISKKAETWKKSLGFPADGAKVVSSYVKLDNGLYTFVNNV